MTDATEKNVGQEDRERCCRMTVQPVASRMTAVDGKEITFTAPVLTLKNACDTALHDLVVHAALGQEGGTVQDVSGAFPGGTAASLPPQGSVSCPVYDLLFPAHAGIASKVHMFGYRAVLNWRFELAVWAEYRRAAGAPPVRTPEAKWVLLWNVPDPSTGDVVLSIEEGTVPRT